MGKYIINFEDNPGIAPNREKYYKCCEIPWWVATKSQLSELIPYTELDLDAIRKEAYDKGYETAKHECEDCNANAVKMSDDKAHEAYQKGLNDAWETVKELFNFTFDEHATIFKTTSVRDIARKYSISEAIEKIRQYEQAQEEKEIKVGDEVIAPMGVAVITEITDECFHFIHADGSYGFDYKRDAPRKTGRHFPEIAEVLQKMKEERA